MLLWTALYALPAQGQALLRHAVMLPAASINIWTSAWWAPTPAHLLQLAKIRLAALSARVLKASEALAPHALILTSAAAAGLKASKHRAQTRTTSASILTVALYACAPKARTPLLMERVSRALEEQLLNSQDPLLLPAVQCVRKASMEPCKAGVCVALRGHHLKQELSTGQAASAA